MLSWGISTNSRVCSLSSGASKDWLLLRSRRKFRLRREVGCLLGQQRRLSSGGLMRGGGRHRLHIHERSLVHGSRHDIRLCRPQLRRLQNLSSSADALLQLSRRLRLAGSDRRSLQGICQRYAGELPAAWLRGSRRQRSTHVTWLTSAAPAAAEGIASPELAGELRLA